MNDLNQEISEAAQSSVEIFTEGAPSQQIENVASDLGEKGQPQAKSIFATVESPLFEASQQNT